MAMFATAPARPASCGAAPATARTVAPEKVKPAPIGKSVIPTASSHAYDEVSSSRVSRPKPAAARASPATVRAPVPNLRAAQPPVAAVNSTARTGGTNAAEVRSGE
jgi:hypothetical protein